jgi:hypothetical protein
MTSGNCLTAASGRAAVEVPSPVADYVVDVETGRETNIRERPGKITVRISATWRQATPSRKLAKLQ